MGADETPDYWGEQHKMPDHLEHRVWGEFGQKKKPGCPLSILFLPVVVIAACAGAVWEHLAPLVRRLIK